MTRSTNARIAGFTYLFYIAVALPSMVLDRRATAGEGIAAQMASMAQHASQVRAAAVLGLLGCFSALVLAVTFYAVTRDEDRDVALFGLTCRVAEGISGAVFIPLTLALLWLATGSNAPDRAAAQTLAALFFKVTPIVAEAFFAAGSTAFCYLLLRGRMIPAWLAWLGVLGSALFLAGSFLRLGGSIDVAVFQWTVLPVAVFELVAGPWLLIKGVPPRAPAQ